MPKIDALSESIDEAIAGRDKRLFEKLSVGSGLPGTRMNVELATTFAEEIKARGKRADKLIYGMARLDPLLAAGATSREFLPVCGVIAIGGRAALDKDPKVRREALALLHEAADDTRFRVREAAAVALAKLGAAMGDALVHEAASWTDGFHQAACVLVALGDAGWLAALTDPEPALARLEEAFALARDAPRSAARWPGRKALVEALGTAPAALATRFGVPVFDLLAKWSKTEMPELRDAIEQNLRSGKLKGRYAAEIDRVRSALGASAPVPRDPTLIVHGTRGRGKKRRK